MRTLTVIVITWLLLYTAFSVGNAGFDITIWSQSARLGLCFCMVIGAIITALVNYTTDGELQ